MKRLVEARGSAWFRRIVVVGGLVSLVLGMAHARSELNERKRFEDRLARVEVEPPSGKPEISQESIDMALAMYGIQIPPGTAHPRLDRSLHDRGLTSRGPFMNKAKVTIGPAAFDSWGLLGSTLAHEVEVHCNQNFFFIYVLDMVGLGGTDEAERRAYLHELHHAERFGLRVEDAQLIADTMNYYYPKEKAADQGNELTASVRSWLAKNLLQPEIPESRSQ